VKVAAIYRVSTDKQLKREGDDTIPVQRQAVREFIAGQTGWTLVKEYAEEGVSGFKVSADDRDVLQQAFRDARAGLWEVLVVFKADRLSRNSFEYPIVIDRFRKIGCQVWSVKDAAGGKLLALDTQMDKFVRFLEGWQAETESKNTSIRVTEAMLQMAKQGKWSGGPNPYGYQHNKRRRPKSEELALIVDPDEAKVIELMVRLYLEERMGCMLIAHELNRKGIPYRRGKSWDDQGVRRILQNPIIAGLPAYSRTRQSGDFFTRKNPYELDQFILPRDETGNLKPIPEYQIIPLDQWLKLIAAMKTAKTRHGSEMPVRYAITASTRSTSALLTGVVFCGHCGSRLSPDARPYKSRRKDGTYTRASTISYICKTQMHKGRDFCDGQRGYGQKRLETTVLNQLETLLTMMDGQELADMVLGGAGQGRSDVEEQIRLLQAEVTKVDRVIDGWLARMDAFLANPEESPFSEEMLTAKVREARERRQHLSQSLKALEQERRQQPATQEQVSELARLAPHWWHFFKEAPREDQKILLRDLIERISVRRGEVEIYFRVDLAQFLPKAREMASSRAADISIGGSIRHTEPLTFQVLSR
jgi:DNA invertase Pin-like site-specific DNA recombinase